MSEVAKKEGSSKPRISLSFELTRTGLLQLNKAEGKIEEVYEVENKVKKPKKIEVETEKSAESEENKENSE